ncbi:MAG TPA: molybdopterin cofactor-binding domain-containing protein, partial [Xanthobacteraceae bacterium]|nr:molybdopterin cofactor-binding domain-containing protein [Xanthobacteraceae bacterium]
MGKIERNTNGTLSRRGFLQSSAGLTFALTLPTALFARPAAALADNATAAAVGAWVTISPDGAVVLAIPVAEMGQGSSTGLAMVLAEEMDADWSRVSITYPPVKPEIFGNPI